MSVLRSKLTIAIIAVLTAGAAFLASRLQFNYDFEAYFPQQDPATDLYLEFRDAFQTDNDFFIIAIERPSGVFDASFLSAVDSLSASLRRLEDVTEVIGPGDLVEYVRDPVIGTVFKNEILRIDDPSSYAADSARIWQAPGLVGVFFAEDGKSVAINLRHTEMLSKKKCDRLAGEIEREVGRFPFEKTHIIGRALGQRLYVELIIRELALFISLSLVLTVIFLFIAFRSGWGVIIPTMVVLLSILWTLGFLKIIGKDIDLMLTILPTIIFVVGMSDSVHVLTKYMQELRNGRPKAEAIRYAFRSIRLATFLTALTTSIGFLTLVFSNIQPISDFGIYTSVGVMLAYGLTYTLLPAVLLLATPRRMHEFALSDDFWTTYLHRWLAWIFRHRSKVLWGAVIAIGISVYGITRIEVDNKMLEDLRESHLLKKEFAYMEEHYSGCRPFELGIFLQSGENPMSPEYLQQLDTLNSYLISEYGVGSQLSLPVLVRAANKSLNGGQEYYDNIPTDSLDLVRIEKFFARKDLRPIRQLVWNDSLQWLRFAGKIPDAGRQHYDSANLKLDQFIRSECPVITKYEVTGTAHLIDLNNRYLVENMIWDLLLSVMVIGLIMGFVYKSWKMVPLTIIPNLLPLVMVGGIMGFTGIPLKVSTSIIFNIAFGIAVDDTIHFLARVRTLLGEGYSREYAVKRTFLTTGKAMIVTTLILSGGFLTLVFSDFMGTFYIGLLISLTLFIAIVAELMITPVVVVFFFRPSVRQSAFRKKDDDHPTPG